MAINEETVTINIDLNDKEFRDTLGDLYSQTKDIIGNVEKVFNGLNLNNAKEKIVQVTETISGVGLSADSFNESIVKVNDNIRLTAKTMDDSNNVTAKLKDTLSISADSVSKTSESFSALNVTTDTITKTTEVAGKSTGIFSKVLSAIPYVDVAFGIGSLVFSLLDLTGALDSEKTAFQQSVEEAQKATAEHAKLREEAQKVAESGVVEIDHYSKLKEELDGLVDANGKVKEGYADRANFILTTLSGATGVEAKMVDGVIQNYDSLGKEIEKAIEQKRAKIILDAHEKEYADAIQNQVEALKKVAEEEEKLQKIKAEKAKWLEDYKMSNRDATDESSSEAWNAYIESQEEGIEKLKDNYKGYGETIRNYEQASADYLSGNCDKINETLTGTNDAYASNLEERKTMITDSISSELTELGMLNEEKDKMTESEYQKEKTRIEQSIIADKEKLFAMQNSIWDATPQYADAMKYLQEQGMAAYDENGNMTEAAKNKITELRDGALSKTPELEQAYEVIAKLGPAAYDENGNMTEIAKNKINELKDGALSKTGELEQAYGAIAKLGPNAFNDNGSLSAAGLATIAGYSKGVQTEATKLTNAKFFEGIAGTLVNPFKKFLDINSPSKLFKKFGTGTMKGFGMGVVSESKNTAIAMGTMAKELSSTFDKAVNFKDINPVAKLSYNISRAGKLEELSALQSNFEQSLNNELSLKAGAPIQNIFNYNFDQTINSASQLSASQIATQTEAMIRRERWNV